MTTIQDIQDTLDLGPSFFKFPGEVVTAPHGSSIKIRRSMTIDWAGTKLVVPGSAIPLTPLLDSDSLPDGARVEHRNLTIQGPDTLSWTSDAKVEPGAIQWSQAETRHGIMILRNVKTTGGYYGGVVRSGGGALELFDCELSGWTAGWACWDSKPNPSATATLVRCRMVAGPNTRYSSIGGYVHECVRVDMVDCYHEAWNRFAVYVNGNPKSTALQTLTNVTAKDCALIQTGDLTTTILMRCLETGKPRNGGSQLWGPVVSVLGTWESEGMIGFANGGNRLFVRDVIAPPTIPGVNTLWAAAGAQASGGLILDGCDVRIGVNGNRGGALLSMTQQTTMAVILRSLTYTSPNTNNNPRIICNVEGGSLHVVECPGLPKPIRSLNGVLV